MRIPFLLALPSAVLAGLLPRTGAPQALYYLDNNPSGASIVSLKISTKDGTLSDPVRTSTSGIGMFGQTATGAAQADTLFSQDAVLVNSDRLFTVNPGSSTLSLFKIPENDPTHPVLVGKPQSTIGEFPSSVAFSHDLHLACVLNTGARGGVACFHVDSEAGLIPAGPYMQLPIAESTPPTGPPNTASDIVFNPSQTALFVTVKGDGTNPGYLYAFAVKNGALLAPPVVSRPADLLVDFGLTFIDDRHAVVADPSYGASFIEIAYPSLEVTVTNKVTVTGQAAICWITYSDRFNAVYLLDAGHPNITALDPVTGNIKYVIPSTVDTTGNFDSTVSGTYLYSLRGAAAISVFDLTGSVGNHKVPKLVQDFNLSSLGSRQGWQGLAVYPN